MNGSDAIVDDCINVAFNPNHSSDAFNHVSSRKENNITTDDLMTSLQNSSSASIHDLRSTFHQNHLQAVESQKSVEASKNLSGVSLESVEQSNLPNSIISSHSLNCQKELETFTLSQHNQKGIYSTNSININRFPGLPVPLSAKSTHQAADETLQSLTAAVRSTILSDDNHQPSTCAQEDRFLADNIPTSSVISDDSLVSSETLIDDLSLREPDVSLDFVSDNLIADIEIESLSDDVSTEGSGPSYYVEEAPDDTQTNFALAHVLDDLTTPCDNATVVTTYSVRSTGQPVVDESLDGRKIDFSHEVVDRSTQRSSTLCPSNLSGSLHSEKVSTEISHNSAAPPLLPFVPSAIPSSSCGNNSRNPLPAPIHSSIDQLGQFWSGSDIAARSQPGPERSAPPVQVQMPIGRSNCTECSCCGHEIPNDQYVAPYCVRNDLPAINGFEKYCDFEEDFYGEQSCSSSSGEECCDTQCKECNLQLASDPLRKNGVQVLPTNLSPNDNLYQSLATLTNSASIDSFERSRQSRVPSHSHLPKAFPNSLSMEPRRKPLNYQPNTVPTHLSKGPSTSSKLSSSSLGSSTLSKSSSSSSKSPSSVKYDDTDPCHVINGDDIDEDENEEGDNLLKAEQRANVQSRIGELPKNCFQGKRLTAYGGRAPGPVDPDHLYEGIRFKTYYLGSTQLITASRPNRTLRTQQAHEAVTRIKAPEGEFQPSTLVYLFISTENIALINIETGVIILEHRLRSISYIADISNLVVIMARRNPEPLEENCCSSGQCSHSYQLKPSKIVCHLFESDRAQIIAQAIGQAFHLAYLDFLKANGIEEENSHELDYMDILNQQELHGDDLVMFASKEASKEIVLQKLRNEPLGIVIIESGWGSIVPTFVVANMNPSGPAARSGSFNVGDQLLAINGTSVVGLTLPIVQSRIKALRSECSIRLTIIQCPPTTSVVIKRPSLRYQLGFSVQNGTICSLMRGGIAERGGVRVGHRIIEINGESVVAVAHEKIVETLANSSGAITMKTMPISMFRLLTGQETPTYI